jgi:hypothetical protein
MEDCMEKSLYEPAREGERWRIRKTKDIKDIIQGVDIVKFI